MEPDDLHRNRAESDPLLQLGGWAHGSVSCWAYGARRLAQEQGRIRPTPPIGRMGTRISTYTVFAQTGKELRQPPAISRNLLSERRYRLCLQLAQRFLIPGLCWFVLGGAQLFVKPLEHGCSRGMWETVIGARNSPLAVRPRDSVFHILHGIGCHALVTYAQVVASKQPIMDRDGVLTVT